MSTFFEGEKKKGSCLEVKFWSLYPSSLENTWEISLPAAGRLKELVFAFRIQKGRTTHCSPDSLIVGETLSTRRGLENPGLRVGVSGGGGQRVLAPTLHPPFPLPPSPPPPRDSLLFTLGRLQLLFLNV